MQFFSCLLSISLVFFIALHIRLTKSDAQRALLHLLSRKKARQEVERELRVEDELMNMRVRVLGILHKVMIHICFIGTLVETYCLMRAPSLASSVKLASPIAGYSVHALIQAGILGVQRDNLPVIKVFSLAAYGTHLATIIFEADLQNIWIMEKFTALATVMLSAVFIDLKVSVPAHASAALVIGCKQLQLIGSGHVTSMHIFVTLVSLASSTAVLVFIVFSIRSHIAAKVSSDDKASFLLGFRRILKGACDGDLLLNSQNCVIVGDATSLERMLTANRNLAETNFLDLFLDAESRDAFQQFLQREAARIEDQAASIPPCFRISLQGAAGPVSMDAFCTRCGAAGLDYYLLALKADPDHYDVPPDAPEAPNLTAADRSMPNGTRPPSQSSEMERAFEELVQVSLLVNNETSAWDIDEVTFSFDRSPHRNSMPTLRSFLRVNDWPRLEGFFHAACQNPPDPQKDPEVFRYPSQLMFRVPGGKSRSYLCAKNVQICNADDDFKGKSRTCLVQLSTFDTRFLRYTKEQDLESIGEEAVPEISPAMCENQA